MPARNTSKFTILAATGFGILAGCASTPKVVPSAYSPPTVQPPVVQSDELIGSARATLENAVRGLTDRGFLTANQAQADLLVSTFSGPLEGLVDCGVLILPESQQSRQAASAQLSIGAFPDRPTWQALRQMRLDARAVTSTRPVPGGFRARTDVTYVVTRTIDTVSGSGAVLGTDREIISFESGGVGRFENGLTCQPTGGLETRVNTIVAEAATLGGGIDGLTPMDEALPMDETQNDAITTTDLGTQAPLLAEPGDELSTVPQLPDTTAPLPLPPAGAVPVTPLPDLPELDPPTAAVLSKEDAIEGDSVETTVSCGSIPPGDVADLASGGCGLQRFADKIGSSAYPAFDIAIAGGADGLAPGSPLTLEVSLPGGDRYFHVAYLASDGLIYHAGPKYIDRQGIGERFLYQTGIDLQANDQIELIVAMASPSEIFSFERPQSEPALDFLALMSERFNSNDQGLAVISVQRPMNR